MAVKLNIEVEEIFNGKDTRTLVTIRPKDQKTALPCVKFALGDETVNLSPGGAAGGHVNIETLPFVRDAIDFILTYLK